MRKIIVVIVTTLVIILALWSYNHDSNRLVEEQKSNLIDAYDMSQTLKIYFGRDILSENLESMTIGEIVERKKHEIKQQGYFEECEVYFFILENEQLDNTRELTSDEKLAFIEIPKKVCEEYVDETIQFPPLSRIEEIELAEKCDKFAISKTSEYEKRLEGSNFRLDMETYSAFYSPVVNHCMLISHFYTTSETDGSEERVRLDYVSLAGISGTVYTNGLKYNDEKYGEKNQMFSDLIDMYRRN